MLLALFLIAGFALPSSVFSQGRVANYAVTTFSNGYTSIGGTSYGSGDDNVYSLTLPFNFNFDNTSYTSGSLVRFCTNGWLQFSGSASGTNYSVLNSTAHPNEIVFGGADMYVLTAIYQSVTGASPNRVWTIECAGFATYSYRSSYSDGVQLKLYETSNVIEVIYKTSSYYLGGVSFGIGLNGNTSPSFSNLSWMTTTSTPSTAVRFTPPIPPGQQLSVSPKSINFGSIVAGTPSADYAVTVRNAGITTNLVISSATISGASDYQIVSSPASNTYAPGQSGTYMIRLTPNASGARNAVFNVVSNGLDSGTQTVNLTGVGIAPQVTYDESNSMFRKTRTRLGDTIYASTVIRSTGNGPLTITGINITGEYANNYFIKRMPSLTLQVGTADTLIMAYMPREEGLRTAQVTITTNAIQNPNKTITMYGSGILAHLSITPTSVHFDSVAMGDTAWRTVRLENMGSDTLAVKLDYVTFADKDFTYYGLEGSDSLIAPEKFRDIQIRFIPTSQGSRQARLRLTTNIPMTFETIRRDTSVFIVDIYGTAVPYGLISITGPTQIDSSIIGKEACQTVKIMNNGQIPLTINSAVVSGPDAAEFTINGLTLPAMIAPGSFINVQVCGTPTARGLRTAMVDVTSSSSDRTTVTQLPLALYGLAVCGQASTATAFENEIVLVGTSSTAQILINNCGDVARAFTATVTGTGYTITSPTTSGMIAPGDNATFDVSFNPTVMSALPGTLKVTADDVTDIFVNLAGTGGNVMITAANTTAPETALGSTSPEFTVNVTNTGNMELTPGDPTISSTEFAYIAGSGPATIAAGQTGTYKFTFTPAASGNRTANVTFPGSVPALAAGTSSFILSGSTPSGAVRPVASNGYELGQNYPNPFNPSTVITFTMAEAGMAKIIVSDVTGNVVTTVADQFFNKGENTVTFDASNVASGTYFYEMIANGVRLQRSMLLNK
jgi:hypothetical protein